MIQVEEHRSFKKYYRKLSAKEKLLYKQRVLILQQNPRHPLLKLHSLKGNMKNYFAFSLSEDLRVIFKWETGKKIILHRIGTHNQVY